MHVGLALRAASVCTGHCSKPSIHFWRDQHQNILLQPLQDNLLSAVTFWAVQSVTERRTFSTVTSGKVACPLLPIQRRLGRAPDPQLHRR